MKLIIIRHTETIANEQKLIYGEKEFRLTEKGIEQARQVVKYLKEEIINENDIKVITSPRKRTIYLAKEIKRCIDNKKIDIEINENAKEMNYGIFEGHTIEEVENKYNKEYSQFCNNFYNMKIKNGDSYEDFVNRIEKLIKYVDNLENYDYIIIITHGGVIRELYERLLETKKGASWEKKFNNGCIMILEKTSKNISLKQLKNFL